jgi:hypothetical protein
VFSRWYPATNLGVPSLPPSLLFSACFAARAVCGCHSLRSRLQGLVCDEIAARSSRLLPSSKGVVELSTETEATLPDPDSISDQRIAKEMIMLATECRQLRARLETAHEEESQIRSSIDRMRDLVEASAASRALAVTHRLFSTVTTMPFA